MAKLITVFGATGLQGSSVIKAIQGDSQLSKEFTIRAVTRDTEKPSAQKLKEADIQVVAANQDDPQSLKNAIQGSHTVFLVTFFEETYSLEKEVQQGKNVVDACRDASVKHLIFSTLTDIKAASNGKYTKVYHFDSKAKIEQYIRDIKLPATFVPAGSYMQNFFWLINKADDGNYTMTLPVNDEAKFPLIDVAGDYGKFVKVAIKRQDSLQGQTIYGAQKYCSPSEILATYSRVLNRPTKFVTITPAEFIKTIQPPSFAEDLAEMLQAFTGPGYFAGKDLGESQALLEDDLCNWQSFVEKNKESF